MTLSVVFFPSDAPTVGLLNTLLVFGSAFLVRPLGALFFGWLGDRMGRRVSLISSITVLGTAAGLTGMLPGYAVIGVWIPVLLVVLRMVQGFSARGEVGGASSYIREWADPSTRPVDLSLIPTFAQLGKGTAAGVAALVSGAPGGAASPRRRRFRLSLGSYAEDLATGLHSATSSCANVPTTVCASTSAPTH